MTTLRRLRIVNWKDAFENKVKVGSGQSYKYMCQSYMENEDKLILSESPSEKEHIDGTDTPAGKGVF